MQQKHCLSTNYTHLHQTVDLPFLKVIFPAKLVVSAHLSDNKESSLIQLMAFIITMIIIVIIIIISIIIKFIIIKRIMIFIATGFCCLEANYCFQ